MNKGLAEMFHYNAWANRALFEATVVFGQQLLGGGI